MTAYSAGTMLMLADTIAAIGCAAAMPRDHKNEWLQNKFSLYPAGRIVKPNGKGTHLLWKKTDVERAKRLWVEFAATKASPESPAKKNPSPLWRPAPPRSSSALGLDMIFVAEQLLRQAAILLAKPSVA